MITFELNTHRRHQLVDITQQVEQAVLDAGLEEGAVLVQVPHTTAGLITNEGYDPAVSEDILAFFERLVPATASYRHSEGNSPAHIKSTLVGVFQLIPVSGNHLALGTWQALFFAEFDGPRRRKVQLTLLEAGDGRK